MSEIQKILDNYKAIKARFKSPPNAVADTGMHLGRVDWGKELPRAKLVESGHKHPEDAEIVPLPPPVYVPPTEPVKWLTFSSTLKLTAREFGLTSEQLKEKTRRNNIVFPRQVAIYIGVKQRRWSMPYIGKQLGLDHTTVLHARNKIEKAMEGDQELREKIEKIEAQIALLPVSPVASHHQSYLESQQRRQSLPKPTLSSMD